MKKLYVLMMLILIVINVYGHNNMKIMLRSRINQEDIVIYEGELLYWVTDEIKRARPIWFGLAEKTAIVEGSYILEINTNDTFKRYTIEPISK
jgi:hypothetical protein